MLKIANIDNTSISWNHANNNVYRVGQKTWQFTFVHIFTNYILIDFHNSSTGTHCRQYAIMWLLHIPPHHKCFSTLPCKISIKYAYTLIMANKHFGKIEKKHFRPTLQWMVCMTLNCVGLTQSSVIQIIHCNVGLNRFSFC